MGADRGKSYHIDGALEKTNVPITDRGRSYHQDVIYRNNDEIDIHKLRKAFFLPSLSQNFSFSISQSLMLVLDINAPNFIQLRFNVQFDAQILDASPSSFLQSPHASTTNKQ